MYGRMLHGRRVLRGLVRPFYCGSQHMTSATSSHHEQLSNAAALSAAAIAALACVCMSGDRGVCEREKIVWVDVHGKKVAVHEKAPEASKGMGRPGAARQSRYYPYVIIGYGVAGQSALRSLLEQDPGAKVLVVDARVDAVPHAHLSYESLNPFARHPQGGKSQFFGRAAGQEDHNVEFASGVRATALDADRGILKLARRQGGQREGGNVATAAEEVSFGRCLLALGSRSRPPPPGFVDPDAWGSVSLLGSRDGVDRECLKRDVVEGKAVTVVGSSWQALELACCLQGARDSLEKGGGIRMVFSDFAPLDHVLPRYLSVALLRRLNKRNIKTMGHSSLRWIGPSSPPTQSPSLQASAPRSPPVATYGMTAASLDEGDSESMGAVGEDRPGAVSDEEMVESPLDSSSLPGRISERSGESSEADTEDIAEHQPAQIGQGQGRRRRRLQVLTAHSFDHLDTSMHSTDRVVLAGVDVAPLAVTLDVSGNPMDETNAKVEGGKGAGTLEVDALRGAVMVNAELAASSRVWCAGDVACYPSEAHGGSRRVLRTADHAYHSGKVAGCNMAAAARGDGGQRYRHSPAFMGEAPLVGVRFATVGDCDAALSTHGFWWTNSATKLTRKSTNSSHRNADRLLKEEEHQRPSGITLRSRKTARKDFTPVFGTGVVFYTSGPKVKGAMIWGFPGEVTAAAARELRGSPSEGVEGEVSAAEEAAGISARALELLRHIMERSANMEADLSDERVMHAWIQGLTHAAKAVAQETGLGNLQPTRRSIAGRVTSSTRRPPGSRDELMYQNKFKTSSAQRRLREAYAARMQGVEPQPFPTYSTGGLIDAEFDPEVMEFFGYGANGGVFDEERGNDSPPAP